MNAGQLTVVAAGSTQITDLGRRRGPSFGVPVNGALDQRSARIANILVGNAEAAPLLELTALDFEFVVDVDVLIAVAGADAFVTVGGIQRDSDQPVSVQAGELVAVGGIHGGLRAYVAVRGSFDVPQLLGSCAPDSVLGFGGRLAAGDTIPVRDETAPVINDHFGSELYRLAVPPARTGFIVDVTDGPDIADFGETAERIFEQPYLVGPASNHIGLRMTGPLPERRSRGEVLSRGVPVGAVEAPPGDELLVLHRGRGVTAGYPVLAVVTSYSLDVLAQIRPGQQLRFRRISAADAAARVRADRASLDALRSRTESVFAALEAPSDPSFERTLS
ncbi:5-oxoprolinase subunit C family protein [Microbacterium sp. GXF0217]